MHFKLIILIVLLLVGCSKSDSKRTVKQPDSFGEHDKIKNNGDSKIKKISEYRMTDYQIVKGRIIADRSKAELVSTKHYTETGFLIKSQFWMKYFNRFPDQHMDEMVYLFKDDKPIKFIKRDKSASREYPETNSKTARYDKNGNIIEEVWEIFDYKENYGEYSLKDPWTMYRRTVSKYDEYNCLIEESEYEIEVADVLLWSTKYEYNDENKVKYRESFNKNSALDEKRELKSNEWGEWYVFTRYKDGKTEIDDSREIISGEKDSQGNVIRRVFKDGRESTHEFKNGYEVGLTFKSDNKMNYSSTKIYREDGLLLEETTVTTEPDFKKERVIYRYDSQNNWVEKITLDNKDEIYTYYVREILYYR